MKYRIQLQTLLFCLLVPCAPLQAHPVSFIDAWAKVGDVVEVRLNIFLEDVLRYQMPTADLTNAMPVAEAQQAVENYSRTLLQQLKILDETGQPLLAELTGQPTWQPRDKTIVPSEESLLKLTWHLSFKLSDERPPKAICFLHEFTGQSQQSPGELRVHLLHTKSGRRIDAVVPPWIPHTIVLPTETGSATSLGLQTPHSRIVVGALDIVHEFVAPVAMLDILFPEAPDLRRRQLKMTDSIPLTSNQMQAIESAAKAWADQHIHMQINGSPVTLYGVEALWFAPDSENQAQQPTTRPAVLPFIGTRLAVRASYRGTGRADAMRLSIDKAPGAVTELTSEIVSPTEQTSEILAFPPDGDDSAGGLFIDWTRVHVPPPSAESINRATAIEPLTVSTKRPGLAGILIAALVVIAGLVGAQQSRSLLLRTAVVFTSTSTAAVAVWATPDLEYRVNEAAAAALASNLLNTIYYESTGADEVQAVTALADVLSADLTEEVYLATCESLRTDVAEPLLVSISSVDVEEFVAAPSQSAVDTFAGQTRWRVVGQVHHWGHTHSRTMIQAARIVLRKHGQTWKIESISQTEAPRIETSESVESES